MILFYLGDIMDIKNDKYIIFELIPTNTLENGGKIIQLSALKINGLNLIDRFDYRLKDEKLPIIEMKSWIDYDIESFKYVDDDSEILKEFNKFIDDYTLLLLDDIYTPAYIKDITNNKEQILKYLNIEYDKFVINNIMDKYHIQPTNYIVDILYEALMMEYK